MKNCLTNDFILKHKDCDTKKKMGFHLEPNSKKQRSLIEFKLYWKYRLVVGAPQENASSIQSNLPTGAAYACDVPRFKCRQLPFRKGAGKWLVSKGLYFLSERKCES